MTELVRRQPCPKPPSTPSKELVPTSRLPLRQVLPTLPAVVVEELGNRLKRLYAGPAPNAYLGLGEKITMSPRHRHWIVPLKDIAGSKRAAGMPLLFIGLMLLGWAMPGVWWILMAKFLIAMGHLVYWVYCIAAWRFDVILATDRQLIRMHGVFTRTTNAVELDRIKERWVYYSIPGRLLGYATLQVVANDGSQQRLGELDYLSDAGRIYRATL